MWVLESFGGVVVAGPFKSEAEMAKKIGLSQQYVNRQIRNCNFRFRLDGRDVLARREKEFVGGGKRASDKEELAMRLGVPQEAIEKVLSNNSSGFVQTPNGKVKIQKLKPGEKPTLPAVRVLWNDDTEKQDFVSFAAAAKELKIDPKTIPSALKAGRDSFTRKSDGKKFTIEIPKENTPSQKKPKPPSEEQKRKWAEAKRKIMITDLYRQHSFYPIENTSIEEMIRYLEIRNPEGLKAIQQPSEEPPQQPKEDPSEEEETHSEDPSEEEDSSEEEEDETHSEEPPQPPIPCPIPAPRKKVPIPAPRKKVPIPAPRKKVPIPAPRKKVPSVPVIPPEGLAASVPLPRRKVPLAPPKASPEKIAPPPMPPEVAEIIRAGKTFPFETSKKLEITTFLSAEKLARFIKSGCGKMFVQGPKKHQTLICNGKMVFLPDLVREIIVFHIRDQMWKDEDGAEAFVKKVCEYNFSKTKMKDWITGGFFAGVRMLDDEKIEQICKEFMKMV